MAKKLAWRDTLAERLASNYTVRINKLVLSWRRDRLVNLSEKIQMSDSSLSNLMELLSAQFGRCPRTTGPHCAPLCSAIKRSSLRVFTQITSVYYSTIRTVCFLNCAYRGKRALPSSKITQLSESSRNNERYRRIR